MDLNRRFALTAIAAGGIAAAMGVSLNATLGIAPAHADADPKTLLEPGALGDIIIGSDQAPVTIVEYASMTCPHCAEFTKVTFPQLKEKYIDTGKVRFIFREFPFDDLALAASMVARCAPKEKYMPLIEMFFEQQGVWTQTNPREELFKIAKLSGMTQVQFDECLKKEDVAKGILAVRERATKEFGVDSTPTFFVNGKILKGDRPLAEFDKMIAAATSG